MLWKCCTQYASKFGTLSNGHRTGKGNAKEHSNYCTIALISHASKVMLKILQARLQQYVNCELPDVQLVLEKAEEPEIKLPTSLGSLKKQESSRKTSTSALLTTPKPWLCGSQQTVGNSSRDGNTRTSDLPPEKSVCRNLYEAAVRTGHETTDWFQIRKGVHQGCILSPCLFNLYAECIIRNAGLDEAQAGIKIARRNINNFRYIDDTTLVAETKN